MKKTDSELLSMLRSGLSKLAELKAIGMYDVWVRPSFGRNLYNAGASVALADGSRHTVTIRTLGIVIDDLGPGKSAAVYVRTAIEKSIK